MVRRTAATAALLTLLSGCTGQELAKSDRVEPTETTEPTEATEATEAPESGLDDSLSDPAEARATFRQVRRKLYRAEQGGFFTSFLLPSGTGTVKVEHEGSYDLVGLRSDYTVTVDSPEGRLSTRVKSTRADSWTSVLEMPEVEVESCWIHLDAGVIEEMTDVPIPDPRALGFPPEVIGVLLGRVDDYSGDGELAGTSDLYTVASMFSGQIPRTLGIPPRSRKRVPVVFTLVEGRLVGWSAELADVVGVAKKADYLPPAIQRDLRRHGERGYSSSIEVELENTGDPWTFRAPPPRDVVEMDSDTDVFGMTIRSCTGVDQGRA